MSDDVKDFAYYAGAAERVIDTIQDDWPTVDVAATAAIAQVFATLATGAPKADTTHTEPEPCGAVHRIKEDDGHIVLNSPTWCRYIHGHAGNHQCMAGHEWEIES